MNNKREKDHKRSKVVYDSTSEEETEVSLLVYNIFRKTNVKPQKPKKTAYKNLSLPPPPSIDDVYVENEENDYQTDSSLNDNEEMHQIEKQSKPSKNDHEIPDIQKSTKSSSLHDSSPLDPSSHSSSVSKIVKLTVEPTTQQQPSLDLVLEAITTLTSKVGELINIVNQNTSGIKWIEKQIIEIRKLIHQTKIDQNAVVLKHNFPISSEDELDVFWNNVNGDDPVDEDYEKALLQKFKQQGGGVCGKLARNIWVFLFETKIQKRISWSGQHDKMKLEGSNLFQLVLDATLQVFPKETVKGVADVSNVSNREPKANGKKGKNKRNHPQIVEDENQNTNDDGCLEKDDGSLKKDQEKDENQS